MTLFTKDGSAPCPLPAQDFDIAGNIWTSLASNPDGQTACGWTEAMAQPDHDPAAETIAWVDGAWLVTPLSADALASNFEAAKSTKMAALEAARWQRQQTLTWNGRTVPGDDATIGRITGAILRYQLTTDASSINWKFGPADFASLDSEAVVAYGIAIAAHLQACFDLEDTLSAAIMAAADRAALDAVDITAGWPE
jgi:hypothetical protein